MINSNPDLRTPWAGCLLLAVAFAAGCGTQAPVAEAVEVDEASDALSVDQIACERTKRECLVAADCDADKRETCETAFRACEEPAREEKKRVRDMCHTTRAACDAAAADEAGHHACHVAEHKCKLPVDPPEAVCHIDGLECVWAARSGTDDAAEKACRDKEKECRDATRVDRDDLPEPPKCGPPPPPKCTPADVDPAEPATPAPTTPSDMSCERTKRECLIAANCDADKRGACETAFRACDEPVREEKKRVHEMCREARETCEESAADEAARHACHMAEHKCRLPVEPPEAVCRIEAEECVWAARDTAEPTPPAEPMTPPDAMTPPDPKEPKVKPEKSAAQEACREKERECTESKRVRPEELPKPPHCGPRPAECTPEAPPAMP